MSCSSLLLCPPYGRLLFVTYQDYRSVRARACVARYFTARVTTCYESVLPCIRLCPIRVLVVLLCCIVVFSRFSLTAGLCCAPARFCSSTFPLVFNTKTCCLSIKQGLNGHCGACPLCSLCCWRFISANVHLSSDELLRLDYGLFSHCDTVIFVAPDFWGNAAASQDKSNAGDQEVDVRSEGTHAKSHRKRRGGSGQRGRFVCLACQQCVIFAVSNAHLLA